MVKPPDSNKDEKSSKEEELDKNKITKVIEDINSDAPEAFKSLPVSQKEQLVENIIARVCVSEGVTTFFRRYSFSGPLPSPDLLAKYNEIHPGFSGVLLNDFKDQGKHRRSLEGQVIKSQLKESGTGQLFAFILALVIILVGGFVMYLGSIWIGVALIVSDITAAIFLYFIGKSLQQKDLAEKE